VYVPNDVEAVASENRKIENQKLEIGKIENLKIAKMKNRRTKKLPKPKNREKAKTKPKIEKPRNPRERERKSRPFIRLKLAAVITSLRRQGKACPKARMLQARPLTVNSSWISYPPSPLNVSPLQHAPINL
jgi:hypothetical protein